MLKILLDLSSSRIEGRPVCLEFDQRASLQVESPKNDDLHGLQKWVDTVEKCDSLINRMVKKVEH